MHLYSRKTSALTVQFGSDDLDSELYSTTRLSALAWKECLNLCWGKVVADDKELEKYSILIHNYGENCSVIGKSDYIASCSHRHVCSAIQNLKQGTRTQCEAALLKKLPAGSSTDTARRCMDFASQSILFLNTERWLPQETLPKFIARTIATKSSQKDDFHIAAKFNARTFAKVAGINIQWTRNLAAHLEVTDDDSNLLIFNGASVLQLYSESSLKDIFPAGFLEETQNTLSLMLPTSHPTTRKWVRKEEAEVVLDPACTFCPYLKASQRHTRHFEFWKDRIIVAKEVFDEHQPRNMLQFLRDDRNIAQYWTFWIAVIAFVLSIVACIEGALQVYKAYRPTQQIGPGTSG